MIEKPKITQKEQQETRERYGKKIQSLVSIADQLSSDLTYLRQERTNPDCIYTILAHIVEGFAESHGGPSHVNGFARQDGIKEICKQLNKLPQNQVFAYNYKITYKQIKK